MGLFSKKSKDTSSEDPNRTALFGNRGTSPAPSQAPSIAPSTSSGYSSPPSYTSQSNDNPYAAHNNARTGGYNAPSGGGGGYGGYGGARNDFADSNRDQLFGGASQRQQQYGEKQGGYGYGQQQQQQPSGGYGGYGQAGRGQGGSGGYNPDRQLSAEEEEEEDVEAVKQQIRFTKQESVASTRNALRVAAQAEETGRNTLGRLGTQGERLHNTEKNLDIASNHNRIAEQKARELKTLNGSMFAVHMKNPLQSKARAQEEERRILERHQSEREEREKTREFGFQSKSHVGNALKGGSGSNGPSTKMSLAERSKYQFEADESDDEKEREIENNLDALGAVTGRLKNLAMATSQEVDRQNVQIDKIMKKSDRVDDQIAVTHNRIKNIH